MDLRPVFIVRVWLTRSLSCAAVRWAHDQRCQRGPDALVQHPLLTRNKDSVHEVGNKNLRRRSVETPNHLWEVTERLFPTHYNVDTAGEYTRTS